MPPRLACWLLRSCLDSEASEAITGDLTEKFAVRVRRNRLMAWIWFWNQTLRSILATRRTPSSPARRGVMMTLGDLHTDLVSALRGLRRSPGFACVAVVTLTIGVGASTAIGAVAYHAWLAPLPFSQGHRLVYLGEQGRAGTLGAVGYATVMDWRAQMTTLDSLAMVRGTAPTLMTDRGAELLQGLRISANYFRTLGVTPALGRDFSDDDDQPDRRWVVILSDTFWRRHFDARPEVIGTSIDLDGRTYQVIGVMPASYRPLIAQVIFGHNQDNDTDVWMPLGYALSGRSSCRTCRHLQLIGRLTEGASLAQVTAELGAVHSRMRRDHPDAYAETTPRALMLADRLAQDTRQPLRLLLGAVVFVLLIASANVASLLVARAIRREQELTMRAALGASRARLVRQLAVESCVLGGIAVVTGTVLAKWGLGQLLANASIHLPRLSGETTTVTLALLATGMTSIAMLICGTWPALKISRMPLDGVLRGSRHGASLQSARAREWLTGIQVAIAVLLVASAGLMFQTVSRLLHVDPGFQSRGVLSMSLSLGGTAWAEPNRARQFQRDLIERLRTLPGLDAAAITNQVPLGENYDRRQVRFEAWSAPPPADAATFERYSVTDDYFKVMEIPIRRGRAFDQGDRSDAEPVVIINERAAGTFWPDRDPIGARINIGGDDDPWLRIVGVARDVRHAGLAVAPTPQFYVSQAQFIDVDMVIVVKSETPGTLIEPVRATVATLAKTVPTYDVATLESRASGSVAERMLLMRLLGVFAAASLALVAIGTYGVVSQAVAARQREFGVRLALGASQGDIIMAVGRRGALVTLAGTVIGLGATLATSRVIASQLYETSAFDPATLAGTVAVVAAVAALAHVLPIRRALAVAPKDALAK